MHNSELESLLREYSDLTEKEDVLIKLKLENITRLASGCKSDEMLFANEITNEFCRIIQILKKQNESKIEAIDKEYSEDFVKPQRHQFISAQQDRKRYSFAWEIQGDFYDFFRDTEKYPASYEAVMCTPVAERKGMVCLTLMDYISRIKAFAKYDLEKMCPPQAIPESLDQRFVFVYDNIEELIARFDASADNDIDKKRKLNMRSALRKLNDFKYGRRTK